MFSEDFLTASICEAELCERLKAVLDEIGSWPQPQDGDIDKLAQLEFIATGICESALHNHTSFYVKLLVACIAIDILRIFAPEAPFDRTQLHSIFSLFLSSFYQLCNPTTLPLSFYLLERIVSVQAFSLAAGKDISEDMLCNLLDTVSSICQKGVGVEAESLLADCIVDFTEECNESSMSTMVFDTFFVPISTCKNFESNQNARVFVYSLQRSPALKKAASQYLFDLKRQIIIESDLIDNAINMVAAIASISPKSRNLVMPDLADDLKSDNSALLANLDDADLKHKRLLIAL
jgi:sister-chromatid-cohesion protein PDS5